MPAAGRVGDKAQCPSDAHGCPGCAHSVIGPAVSGSPDVFINGRPALRVGDPGIHAACCGPNRWSAAKGSESVFINQIAAHRLGDMTVHCGGVGRLIEGSPNVDIGGPAREGPPASVEPDRMEKIHVRVVFDDGTPVANEPYRILDDHDKVVRQGTTDKEGWIREDDLPLGVYRIEVTKAIRIWRV